SQAASARQIITAIVQRFYDPLDVEVVELKSTPTKLSTGESVQGVSSLAEASQLLGANNTNKHNNDCIVFLTGILINGQDQGAGGLLGISSGTDINNFNLTEGSALALVTDIALGQETSNPVNLAVTAAHEAGHNFGLLHSYDTTFSGFLGNAANTYHQ